MTLRRPSLTDVTTVLLLLWRLVLMTPVSRQNKSMLCVSVCVCSRGVLLQRLPDADVAAAADGHPGLRRHALLLLGGEDAELLHRSAGTLAIGVAPQLMRF